MDFTKGEIAELKLRLIALATGSGPLITGFPVCDKLTRSARGGDEHRTVDSATRDTPLSHEGGLTSPAGSSRQFPGGLITMKRFPALVLALAFSAAAIAQ